MIAVTWSRRTLQQSLRLDPLDVELDLPELGVDPDAQLHQVEHLRVQRHPRVEVVELEVDLVDVDDRDVEQDVGLVGVADRPGVQEGVVLVLLLRHGRLAALVLLRPVSVRTGG